MLEFDEAARRERVRQVLIGGENLSAALVCTIPGAARGAGAFEAIRCEESFALIEGNFDIAAVRDSDLLVGRYVAQGAQGAREGARIPGEQGVGATAELFVR